MGFEAESVGYVTICDGAEVERSWPRIVLDFASERRTDSRPFLIVSDVPGLVRQGWGRTWATQQGRGRGRGARRARG